MEEEGGVQSLQAGFGGADGRHGGQGSFGGYKEACCVRAAHGCTCKLALALLALAGQEDGWLGFPGSSLVHCYLALLLIVAGVALGRSVTGSKQALMQTGMGIHGQDRR